MQAEMALLLQSSFVGASATLMCSSSSIVESRAVRATASQRLQIRADAAVGDGAPHGFVTSASPSGGWWNRFFQTDSSNRSEEDDGSFEVAAVSEARVSSAMAESERKVTAGLAKSERPEVKAARDKFTRLRLQQRKLESYHDTMYHSSIASRLASPLDD